MGEERTKDLYTRPVPSIRGLGSPLVRGSKASGPLVLTHSGGRLHCSSVVLFLSFLDHIHTKELPHHSLAHALLRSFPNLLTWIFHGGGQTPWDETLQHLCFLLTSALSVHMETLSLQRLRPPVAFRLHGLSPLGLSPTSFCFSDSVLAFLGSSFPLFLVKG